MLNFLFHLRLFDRLIINTLVVVGSCEIFHLSKHEKDFLARLQLNWRNAATEVPAGRLWYDIVIHLLLHYGVSTSVTECIS